MKQIHVRFLPGDTVRLAHGREWGIVSTVSYGQDCRVRYCVVWRDGGAFCDRWHGDSEIVGPLESTERVAEGAERA